jgi:hypothetical protein
MKKPNLLISYNYFPKRRKYNGEMVNLFVNKGYHCPVLGTNPDHPFWKVQEPSSKERFWYSVEGTTDAKSNGNLKIISCPMHAEDYFSIENIIDSFEHFMLYQKKVPIRLGASSNGNCWWVTRPKGGSCIQRKDRCRQALKS